MAQCVRLESSFIQIDGIGEVTERRLWQHGVTDWAHAPSSGILRRNQEAALKHHMEDARDALAAGDAQFFADCLPTRESWRLTESFHPFCGSLDIETTGLDPRQDVVTTVSLTTRADTQTFVRGVDLSTAELEAALEPIDLLVTFNGAQFDLPFLKKRLDLEWCGAHIDLRYLCRRIGLAGGLKAIEPQLGIHRQLPDVDGREAVRLWYQYQDGNAEALDRLIAYNQEDTKTLLPMLDRVHEEIERAAFRRHLPPERPLSSFTTSDRDE